GGMDAEGGVEGRKFLETLPAGIENEARERLVTAGGVGLRAPAAAAGIFDRHLGVGRRVEVGGGGTRPRILRPLRRRTARKTARRRRGGGPGGAGRPRAVCRPGRAEPAAV